MSLIQQWTNKSNYLAKNILQEVQETIPITLPIPIFEVVKLYVPFTEIYSTTQPEISQLISACATRDTKNGWLILVNGNEPIQRQRFSLAHELGHISVIPNTAETVYCGKGNDWEEKVCDNFAGKILVPDDMLLQFCADNPKPYIEDIVEAFLVSTQVAHIRMRDLALPYLTRFNYSFLRR